MSNLTHLSRLWYDAKRAANENTPDVEKISFFDMMGRAHVFSPQIVRYDLTKSRALFIYGPFYQSVHYVYVYVHRYEYEAVVSFSLCNAAFPLYELFEVFSATWTANELIPSGALASLLTPLLPTSLFQMIAATDRRKMVRIVLQEPSTKREEVSMTHIQHLMIWMPMQERVC